MTNADRTYIESVVKKSGSSFTAGMKILPKDKRDAMFAIYAYCRLIDDIADEPAPINDKIRALSVWRDDIAALYRDEIPNGNPVAQELYGVIKKYNLPQEEFLALIDGMETDMNDNMRAPDMVQLELYCRRVAGAVGVLSVYVFGDSSPEAQRFAVVLGEALQLTNILRDMEEDLELGRLYMPAECLQKAGIALDENTPLSAVLKHPNLKIARQELAQRAFLRYTEAETLLESLDKKQMKAAVLMMKVYKKILLIMEKRGFEVLSPRAKPSKLWLLATVLKTSLF